MQLHQQLRKFDEKPTKPAFTDVHHFLFSERETEKRREKYPIFPKNSDFFRKKSECEIEDYKAGKSRKYRA